MDFRFMSFAILFVALFAFGTKATTEATDEYEDDGDNDDVVSCPPPEYGPNATLVLLPNPTNCSNFFICAHGTPYEFNCPGGLYFNPDPEVNVCDWPINVDCPYDSNGDTTSSGGYDYTSAASEGYDYESTDTYTGIPN